MVGSMVELLRNDMACEGLLDCVYGLKPLDQECFESLAEHGEPMTVDELAEAVGRGRSTAYRSVRRLRQAGLVEKEQVNFDGGSYCHVYYPSGAEEIASEMRRLVDEWYAEMDRLMEEFEHTYRRDRGRSPIVEG